MYTVLEQQLRGLPESPRELRVAWNLEIAHHAAHICRGRADYAALLSTAWLDGRPALTRWGLPLALAIAAIIGLVLIRR